MSQDRKNETAGQRWTRFLEEARAKIMDSEVLVLCQHCTHYAMSQTPEQAECRAHAPQAAVRPFAPKAEQVRPIWPVVRDVWHCGDWSDRVTLESIKERKGRIDVAIQQEALVLESKHQGYE